MASESDSESGALRLPKVEFGSKRRPTSTSLNRALLGFARRASGTRRGAALMCPARARAGRPLLAARSFKLQRTWPAGPRH